MLKQEPTFTNYQVQGQRTQFQNTTFKPAMAVLLALEGLGHDSHYKKEAIYKEQCWDNFIQGNQPTKRGFKPPYTVRDLSIKKRKKKNPSPKEGVGEKVIYKSIPSSLQLHLTLGLPRIIFLHLSFRSTALRPFWNTEPPNSRISFHGMALLSP